MRYVMILGVLCLSATTASAYDGFSPISGPNDSIPSPVCDLINFGFCPQPAPPAPPFPDVNEVRAAAPLPPPVLPRHHRHARRHQTSS